MIEKQDGKCRHISTLLHKINIQYHVTLESIDFRDYCELAEYKSVRGRLRAAELEQKNGELRNKLRGYEDVISRNNLWSYFSRHREKVSKIDVNR